MFVVQGICLTFPPPPLPPPPSCQGYSFRALFEWLVIATEAVFDGFENLLYTVAVRPWISACFVRFQSAKMKLFCAHKLWEQFILWGNSERMKEKFSTALSNFLSTSETFVHLTGYEINLVLGPCSWLYRGKILAFQSSVLKFELGACLCFRPLFSFFFFLFLKISFRLDQQIIWTNKEWCYLAKSTSSCTQSRSS